MDMRSNLRRYKTSRADEEGLHGRTVPVQIADLLLQNGPTLSDRVERSHIVVPHRAGGVS